MVNEPDIEAAGNAAGTQPEQDDTKRRITLSCGEQTVEVEGPDNLQTMAELAAYFWLLTAPAVKTGVGFTAGGALITERAAPYPEPEEEETPQCP